MEVEKMRKGTVLILVFIFSFCFTSVSMAQEGAQGIYRQALAAWQGVKDYSCVMESYNRLGDEEEYKTYQYWYLKPGYIRMKVVKGRGKGGEVFYDPTRDKVRGHKGGFFSFVVLTLEPNDRKVTSIRGVRVDQTSFGYILSQLRPYMDAGQCKKIEMEKMKGFVCTAQKQSHHGDIWKDKVFLNGGLLPVMWERYGKDGTLFYKLVCRSVKINSGFTLNDVAKKLRFKGE